MKDLATIELPHLKAAPRTDKESKIELLRGEDGVQFSCRVWPGEVTKPVILYLHGIEGHSQWFENSANYLNERGFTIYAPDRRGSGLNPRNRGHMANMMEFIGDVNSMLRRLTTEFTGRPIILWGHCWGAKGAVLVAQEPETNPKKKPKREEDIINKGYPISGLLLSCPAIYSKLDFDLKKKLTIAYNHFRGDRRAMKKWDIPLTASMLTDNPVYMNYIEEDPLRVTEVTSTFFYESHRLSSMAQKAAPNLKIPILIVQAGADQIVDVPKVESWLEGSKSPDKQMRIFPDAAHSLDFDETWFKEYMHLVSGWLEARTPVIS